MEESVEIFLTLHQETINRDHFEASVVGNGFVRGYLLLKSVVGRLVQKSTEVVKRSAKVAVNSKSKTPRHLPSKVQNFQNKNSTSATPVETQNLIASDMIKIMQDFQSEKKTFCCVVCRYESGSSGNIKRHVQMKHMPKTVALNCLQCPSSFSLRQTLKRHYMQVHELLEPAAQAMLP